MKDGYYVSCYVTIDPLANIYQAPIADRHDQNVALWKKEGKDISLITYWELERQTRIKHHNRAWYSKEQFESILNELLLSTGIQLSEVIDIWGTSSLNYYCTEKYFSEYTFHNICHLFSALMLETDIFHNEEILGFALDYGSDFETESWKGQNEYVGCVSNKGIIDYFPVASPAAVWAVSAAANQMGEGSLMALATATKCHLGEDFDFTLPPLFRVTSDKIWNAYISYVQPILQMNCSEFKNACTQYDDDFSLHDNKISAIMKKIQEWSIRIMDVQVASAIDRFGLDTSNMYLAIGGGFCLNCPTNSFLMDKYHFKGLLAAPCINDGGQALGIGLFEFYRQEENFNFSFGIHSFYGPKVTLNDSFRIELLASKFVESVSDFDPACAAKDIVNDVVVWFENRAEIGPRALGHRSLLGNPADIKTKNRLNRIKKRQFWRPVAPIVLNNQAARYFESIRESPFMLQTFKIKDEYLSHLPAIAHLDGSARVQTANPNTPGLNRICQLLEEMQKIIGFPIVCNTSLNDRDEPIIEQITRALEFAIENKIHCVYVNGVRIKLKNFDEYNGEFNSIPNISVELFGKSDDKVHTYPFRVTTHDIVDYLYKNRCKCSYIDESLAKEIERYSKYNREKKRKRDNLLRECE